MEAHRLNLLNRNNNWWWWKTVVPSVALYLTSQFGFFLYFTNLANCLSVAYSCMSASLMIFYIKMKQITLLLAEISRKRYITNRALRRYRRVFGGNLRFFFRINEMFGRLFLASLIVCCPISIVFTLWFVLGYIPLENNFFMCYYIFYQFVYIFVGHLALTICTKLIHRPDRHLLTLLLTSGTQQRSLRQQILLSHDYEALHTSVRYGFTYGR